MKKFEFNASIPLKKGTKMLSQYGISLLQWIIFFLNILNLISSIVNYYKNKTNKQSMQFFKSFLSFPLKWIKFFFQSVYFINLYKIVLIVVRYIMPNIWSQICNTDNTEIFNVNFLWTWLSAVQDSALTQYCTRQCSAWLGAQHFSGQWPD